MHTVHDLPIFSVIPFATWLLTIAILPLLTPHFWEKNSNKAILSALFAVPVLIYFIQRGQGAEMLDTAKEYTSFIILLGSLFTVSGGILLKGDIEGKPLTNTIIFLLGGVLANLIGTTGASMVLIRPLLRINSERQHTSHIPVFFIFIVSNIGGCLTPLGDPPLFLGYLRGVPFFWTLSLVPIWLLTLFLILTVFYIYDSIQYKKEDVAAVKRDQTEIEPITLSGKLNLLFLAGIMLGVFLDAPYREITMVLMGVLSYFLTPMEYRKENGFTFGPINEVAILFAAIFITMVPALILLKTRGGEFGITQPWQFFWLTGGLSSFLDNAPTYLTYLSLAQGYTAAANLTKEIVGIPAIYLKAISAGAVLMGANTYIGNGPNFMVKTIAEEAGYKMPSFFGYMVYSCCILIPIFVLVTFVFFV